MAVLTVGSGEQYQTIASAVAAAQPGDTLNVDAGTYTNDFPAVINGLTVEGIGGQVNLAATEQPLNNEAYFETEGNVALKNLTFSGVTVPDGNGSGVRYQGGTLSVQDCAFASDQNGLFANPDANGSVSIDRSEFYDDGTGDGHTHDIYIQQINEFSLINSYVHDANAGHEVKSRAENNTITGDRIYDNQSTASYSIDLPNGGNAVISNDTIEQGPNSQNSAIIDYGEEGDLYGSNTVALNNDTVVNDLPSGGALLFANNGGAAVSAAGNTVYGLSPDQLGGGIPVGGFAFTSVRPALDTTSPVTQQTPAPGSNVPVTAIHGSGETGAFTLTGGLASARMI